MREIDYSRYEGADQATWHTWNLARHRLESDAPMLLEACRERDAEIERLGDSRDSWARMYAACNSREQSLLQIKKAAQWFVDVFESDNAWIENSDSADYGLDVLRSALLAVEQEQ